jgi:anti-anti-sigma regulatory factor
MNSFPTTIGAVAGALSIVGVIPYIITTLQGKTKPHRITWWIFSILGLMMSANHFAAGGSSTVWMPLGGAIGQLVVAILSIRYGEGGWSRLDRLCLGGIGASLIVGQQSHSPLLALGLNIAIDWLGCVPTIQKARHAPESEDWSTWLIYFVGAALNLFAVQHWSLAEALLPLYLFVATGLIAVLLLYSQLRVWEAKYHVARGVSLYQYDRVLLFQLHGPMLLGRSQHLQRGRIAMQMANSVVFDLSQVPLVGWRSSRLIAATIRYANQQGLQVYLVGANPGVRQQLGRLGIFDLVRPQHCFTSCAAALQKALGRMAKPQRSRLPMEALQLF